MQEPRSDTAERREPEKSEFLDSLKKGALLGVLILAIVIPVMRMGKQPQAPQQAPVATAPQAQPAPRAPVAAPQVPADQHAAVPDASPPAPSGVPPAASQAAPQDGRAPVQLAEFGDQQPSAEARNMANWVVHSRDNKKKAFVIIDKKSAKVYVFSPSGKLKGSTFALLGSARGDETFPGVGNKPLKLLKPYEKTTPAGRYLAEIGLNTNKEDVVWVDYEAAVSMHRIRNVANERRPHRLASATIEDNYISNGCVNLPVPFYEKVLSPTVRKQGAVVYVLPEVKSVKQVFASYYEVTDAVLQAGTQAKPRTAARVQRVAMQAR